MATSTETTSSTATGVLTPVLSTRLALRPGHAALCLLLMLVFVVFSYMPLPAGGLWSHVAQGEAFWTQSFTGSAAAGQQQLPLSEGVAMPLSPWLSQAILGGVFRVAGAEGLSALFALVTFAAVLMLAGTFYLQTLRKRFVAAGIVLTLALAWGLVSTLSVETFGFFCLAALLLLLVGATRWQCVEGAAAGATKHQEDQTTALPFAPWLWAAVPVLMILWANLGNSFLVGVLVVAAWAAGHLIDRVLAVGVRAALAEPHVRRRIYLAELALAATLINPYGVDRWLASVRWLPGNWGMAEGAFVPLVLWSMQGALFAGVLLAAAVLLRVSPRRLSGSTIMLFVGGAVAVAIHAPWLLWFAPVAAVLLLPHVAAATGVQPREQAEATPVIVATEDAQEQPATFQFAYTLVCGLLIWTGFALSPLATPILGGKPRAAQQVHSADVPLAVTAWLQQQPWQPKLVWAPANWADYLAYRYQMPIYAGSTLYALPLQVQNDYMLIARGDNWQALADRYAIDLIVASKADNRRLASSIRQAAGNTWQVVYEDGRAVVARRVTPATAQAAKAGDKPQPATNSAQGEGRDA